MHPTASLIVEYLAAINGTMDAEKCQTAEKNLALLLLATHDFAYDDNIPLIADEERKVIELHFPLATLLHRSNVSYRKKKPCS